jgi:hypothetical protein
MRQLIILILVFFTTILSYGQKVKAKNVPPQAKITFSTLYPDVKDVYWGKQHKMYIAEFTDKDLSNSVIFDKDGKLFQIINYIQIKDLPKETAEYIKKNFSKNKIGEVFRTKDAKGVITYNVEIKSRAMVFDEKGKYLRTIK